MPGRLTPVTRITVIMAMQVAAQSGGDAAQTIRLWVDTSSAAMGARTTSVLKNLEHRV